MKGKQQAKILALGVYQALQQEQEQARVKEIVDNFLLYLRRHHLLFLIPDIVKELKAVYYSQQGILPVKIVSRYKLDENLLQQLVEEVKLRTNKEIKPILINDDQIIGGLKAHYADKLLDMTIARQLNELSKQFIN